MICGSQPTVGSEKVHQEFSEKLVTPLGYKQTGLYSYDMSKTRTKSEARQRIVETAERLFYAEGVRAVGIDRIIAESEVAKMTLYNHFASKDDLILTVLKFREEQVNEMFEKSIERHVKKGMDRLEAFFAALKDWFKSPGFRGCSFINACVELADAGHPASRFSSEHKEDFHEMLTEIITETRGAKAAAAAPAIALMVEGAIVTAVMEQTSASADVAKEAALALVSKYSRKRK
jgi:AcrR family transcriptional regulator